MPSWLILLLCAVAAVGLFVLGMSLTLMIKGHHIDSEISTNKNMQRLGIKCAVQETREEDGTAACSDASPAVRLLGQLRGLRHRAQIASPAPRPGGPEKGRSGKIGLRERQESYNSQYFDRQTNQGLCRSASLYRSSASPGSERVVPPASARMSSPAAVSHS